MTTIADRATRVMNMLGNRTDLESRAYAWLRDAYLELGMGFEFEELEETIDTTIDGVNNNNGVYDYPTYNNNNNTWYTRAVKSLVISSNNNTRVVPLVKKDVRWIDKLPESSGDPAIFCPYKNQVILRPIPNTDWNMKWRVWLKPYIVANNNNNNNEGTEVSTTEILLPEDWLEILDYAACLRGHVELLERDKAAEVLQLLYGSEDQRSGRRVPGLVKMKMNRRQAETMASDWGITPRVRKYGS